MNQKDKGLNTICTHYGELEDKEFKGAVSPLYMSTSYAFEDVIGGVTRDNEFLAGVSIGFSF